MPVPPATRSVSTVLLTTQSLGLRHHDDFASFASKAPSTRRRDAGPSSSSAITFASEAAKGREARRDGGAGIS